MTTQRKRLQDVCRFALCTFLLVFIGTVKCDIRTPREEELSRYPEFKPFLTGYRDDFTGGKHDLDTGYYSFSFSTSCTRQEFFRRTDAAATAEGWTVVELAGNKRVYLRRSNAYEAATFNDKVTLVYDDEGARVKFVQERDYSGNSVLNRNSGPMTNASAGGAVPAAGKPMNTDSSHCMLKDSCVM